MHVVGPRTLGFGGFFWHGAWDWGEAAAFGALPTWDAAMDHDEGIKK